MGGKTDASSDFQSLIFFQESERIYYELERNTSHFTKFILKEYLSMEVD